MLHRVSPGTSINLELNKHFHDKLKVQHWIGSLLALLTAQESQLRGLNTSGFCVRGLQKELREKHFERINEFNDQ